MHGSLSVIVGVQRIFIPNVGKKLIRISKELKIPFHNWIDATVLALSLSFKLISIPKKIEYNEYVIPMQIHFPVSVPRQNCGVTY
ncbi:MAG: hypothetical protein J7K33_03130 [Candidatus Marinimicrobia bacterium]|nr:hypothetical protein [Candidatus Neomarinimicrobiota bacterium]